MFAKGEREREDKSPLENTSQVTGVCAVYWPVSRVLVLNGLRFPGVKYLTRLSLETSGS